MSGKTCVAQHEDLCKLIMLLSITVVVVTLWIDGEPKTIGGTSVDRVQSDMKFYVQRNGSFHCIVRRTSIKLKIFGQHNVRRYVPLDYFRTKEDNFYAVL